MQSGEMYIHNFFPFSSLLSQPAIKTDGGGFNGEHRGDNCMYIEMFAHVCAHPGLIPLLFLSLVASASDEME